MNAGRRSDLLVLHALVFPLSFPFGRLPRRLCQAVHGHFYSDVRTKSIPSKTIAQLAFLHPVHTTTEKFENGIVTLQTHQM